jgi:uncharacterized low-complexity protein
MTVGAQMDAFESLAKALGILRDNGSPNDAWFADPVGTSSNPNGLENILSNDGQREAMLSFVDEVLGAPDRAERDGATWVPLFRETNPQVTIFAVVKAVTGAVHIGVGVEHTMSRHASPRASTSRSSGHSAAARRSAAQEACRRGSCSAEPRGGSTSRST